MVSVVQPSFPQTERIGNTLFCDKLPYPAHYVREGLSCVVFVPRDKEAIERAQAAIHILITQGRLREHEVRLRMNSDEKDYEFGAMVDGFLSEEMHKPR